MFNYNMNAAERDRILFGSFDEDKYYGGIRRFDELTAEKLSLLVSKKFADPSDCQNEAPTIHELLDFSKNKLVIFSGYAVSPARDDYRVSVDGIKLITIDVREAADFIKFARKADELNSDCEPDGLTATLSAWWD